VIVQIVRQNASATAEITISDAETSVVENVGGFEFAENIVPHLSNAAAMAAPFIVLNRSSNPVVLWQHWNPLTNNQKYNTFGKNRCSISMRSRESADCGASTRCLPNRACSFAWDEPCFASSRNLLGIAIDNDINERSHNEAFFAALPSSNRENAALDAVVVDCEKIQWLEFSRLKRETRAKLPQRGFIQFSAARLRTAQTDDNLAFAQRSAAKVSCFFVQIGAARFLVFEDEPVDLCHSSQGARPNLQHLEQHFSNFNVRPQLSFLPERKAQERSMLFDINVPAISASLLANADDIRVDFDIHAPSSSRRFAQVSNASGLRFSALRDGDRRLVEVLFAQLTSVRAICEVDHDARAFKRSFVYAAIDDLQIDRMFPIAATSARQTEAQSAVARIEGAVLLSRRSLKHTEHAPRAALEVAVEVADVSADSALRAMYGAQSAFAARLEPLTLRLDADAAPAIASMFESATSSARFEKHVVDEHASEGVEVAVAESHGTSESKAHAVLVRSAAIAPLELRLALNPKRVAHCLAGSTITQWLITAALTQIDRMAISLRPVCAEDEHDSAFQTHLMERSALRIASSICAHLVAAVASNIIIVRMLIDERLTPDLAVCIQRAALIDAIEELSSCCVELSARLVSSVIDAVGAPKTLNSLSIAANRMLTSVCALRAASRSAQEDSAFSRRLERAFRAMQLRLSAASAERLLHQSSNILDEGDAHADDNDIGDSERNDGMKAFLPPRTRSKRNSRCARCRKRRCCECHGNSHSTQTLSASLASAAETAVAFLRAAYALGYCSGLFYCKLAANVFGVDRKAALRLRPPSVEMLRPPRGLAQSGAIVPFSLTRDALGAELLEYHRSAAHPHERPVVSLVVSHSTCVAVTTKRMLCFERVASITTTSPYAAPAWCVSARSWTLRWSIASQDCLDVLTRDAHLVFLSIPSSYGIRDLHLRLLASYSVECSNASIAVQVEAQLRESALKASRESQVSCAQAFQVRSSTSSSIVSQLDLLRSDSSSS